MLSTNAHAQFSGGDGSSGNPYQIATPADLNNIRNYMGNSFILTADIDLDVAPYNTGSGWEPIGTNTSGQEFSGHLDGNGKKIKNLFINRPTENFVGLFGAIRYGTVKKIGIENVDITGQDYVGAITGINYTQISKSYSTGSVKAVNHAGGLAGLLETYTSTGEIINSYSFASVSATTSSAGGLIGRFISGTISKSYASDTVSAPTHAGGLVGKYDGGSVANDAFWNTETSGQTSSSGGGVGKSVKQLKTKSTFTGESWDFSSAWEIIEGDSTSYPYLKNNKQDPIPGEQYKFINYAGGKGTSANPYLISSAVHLDSVRFNLTSHFKLISNIDLNIAPFNTGEGWNPIGTNSSGEEFSGTFDGDGYKVQNLFINRPTSDFVGLFGAAKNALIKDIGVEDVDVSAEEYVGALVGINYSEVRNSYSTGSVNGLNHTGGLIGGIETWDGSTALVINSYSTASAYGSNSVAGGLVGRQISGTIENSYAAGEAFAFSASGGLVGEQNAGTVTNSYWSDEFECQENSADGTKLSDSQLKQQASFSGWDFVNVWNIDENNSFPYLRDNEQATHPASGMALNLKLYNGGCGTETNPYQIATAAQLDSVRYQRNSHFIQTANIDLDVFPFNSGLGWEPINANFTGSYNGNGYQILNLFINRPSTNYIGLFSRITSSGTISSVKIDSVNITGQAYTGALAGFIQSSTLNNVQTSGSVTGHSFTGGIVGFSAQSDMDSVSSTINISTSAFDVGGLIGRSDHSTITNSFSSGSVSGRGNVGGFIGFGVATTTNQSYSNADVTITNGVYGGGFLGRAHVMTISNSYATGSVTSNRNDFAGFVGRTTGGSISNSYSTGEVIGSGLSGGFARVVHSTYITNSFWDTEASAQSNSGGYVVSKTTSEMKKQSSFTGWDFSTIWGIDEKSSYPYLKNNEQTPHPGYVKPQERLGGGFGTESDPYKVATAVHLDSVRHFMSAHFVQVADIDMNVAPFNSGAGWDPIGTNGSGNEFTGTFDGNGYTINNLFINRSSEDFGGLFGAIFDGKVKNVALEEVNITAASYTGALVGISYSDVLNSYATGTVSADNHSGGLVGTMENYNGSTAEVTDSYSLVSFTSTGGNFGGLVGRLISGEINTSYAAGSVTGGTDGNGGLVGLDHGGTVTNSYWDTQTTGQSTSAGGTGLNTAQMQQRSSFSGFDFADTWYIEEKSDYPKFQENKYHEMLITGNEGWRMLSSPVSGTSFGTLLDTLWTQGFTGADVSHGAANVYTWSESAKSFQPLTNASQMPTPGQGFLTYIYSDDDNDGTHEGFPKKLINTSNEFNGQASPSISFTDSGVMANDGWNLVGNPYGTTIKWGAPNGWGKKNLDATFYVWSDSANGGNGSYLSWNGITGTLPNGKIAPWQGFWVKAHATSPEFSINDSTKNSGGSLRKISGASTIKFTAKSETMSSSAIVLFYKDAFLEKDPFDAYKLQPLSSEYLSLFSGFPIGVEDESQLDINALPDQLSGTVELPVNMKLSVNDTTSDKTEIDFSWQLESLPVNWIITLIDLIEDEYYDLKEISSITIDMKHAKASKPKSDEVPVLASLNKPNVVRYKSNNNNRFLLRIEAGESVSTQWEKEIPASVELQQNYPNPFNPSTTIAFGVPETGEVTLEVFDILGRKVATLLSGERKSAGRYTVNFDASNLASGMYMYRLHVNQGLGTGGRAGNSVLIKKLTLIK